MDGQLTIAPGVLIVFEGLDKAGKSTQMEALEAAEWSGTAPHFVHMPSGLTESTLRIHDALEEGGLTSALGKQLFHLACHAENVPAIAELTTGAGVVLDRFWWSTVAYGWYGGRLDRTGLDQSSFMNVISTIWGALHPDLIFLFLDPHEQDDNNIDGVSMGYRAMAEEFSEKTILVPKLSVEDTTAFIVEKLKASALVAQSGPERPIHFPTVLR